jgi:hypothetical protein
MSLSTNNFYSTVSRPIDQTVNSLNRDAHTRLSESSDSSGCYVAVHSSCFIYIKNLFSKSTYEQQNFRASTNPGASNSQKNFEMFTSSKKEMGGLNLKEKISKNTKKDCYL